MPAKFMDNEMYSRASFRIRSSTAFGLSPLHLRCSLLNLVEKRFQPRVSPLSNGCGVFSSDLALSFGDKLSRQFLQGSFQKYFPGAVGTQKSTLRPSSWVRSTNLTPTVTRSPERDKFFGFVALRGYKLR
uniref:Uncharacterized protein n=1 Tax=Cacopsylla melanoneura TaxID=428564 RepID=A0A8D8R3M3_9HEMI